MYIDIHTHNTITPSPDSMGIVNLYSHFEKATANSYYSAGLHPWHLNTHEYDLLQLLKIVDSQNVLAIGECGLDKVCDTDWALQMLLFQKQIIIANACQKPLIIHCVRAFNEVTEMLKDIPAQVPVIFHGYRNNGDIANSLINNGYYLSFGAAILQENAQAATVFKETPLYKCFLETDDANVNIKEIYKKAAMLKNIAEEAIILQMEQNFRNVFKR